MPLATTVPATPAPALEGVTSAKDRANDLVAFLRAALGVEFSVFDGSTGEVLYQSSQQPAGDDQVRGEIVRTIVSGTSAEFIGDEDPVLVLGLPCNLTSQERSVAVAAFVTRHVDAAEDISAAAHLLGLDPHAAAGWINQQALWTGHALERAGAMALLTWKDQTQIEQLKEEVEKISDNLASTYEEISVLYGVTQNLRISNSEEELGRLALDWLMEVLPAEGMAIQHLPVGSQNSASQDGTAEPTLLTRGQCPIDNQQFTRMVQELDHSLSCGPLVLNRGTKDVADWSFEGVRQLIVVPLAEGDNIFGWLAAINHLNGSEFGTVEASLLSSVGTMLGIHCGNVNLYQEQSELLASIVRAMTSAIDAKDPYTCGHSDRVARIAVCLAQQLGLTGDILETIYMAGLLHDIGKIGIDDNVLRKPGRLTPAEFEHIKLHPELGYKILIDLKQIGDVLPAVLHHHEQWDGSGYPHGLAGENIPLLARIVGVADGYDAMSSDRPYRKGMPDERVDEIFKVGAGKQWDPQVVSVFFQVRDDIRTICGHERANLTLDVQQWT